ncbi:MAG: hypothetical protein WAN46_02030 [Gammaproteobacteria bacterium]|jgi:catechol 2,3-dioxygenase-like lactoylglutathione lyase family enzyme
MTRPKLALFADRGSRQLAILADVVREEGGDPFVFDIQLGGLSAPRVLLQEQHAYWDGVDFGDIHAVHIRCAALNTPPTVPALLHGTAYAEFRSQYLREQEYQATTHSFFHRLAALGKLVINPLGGAYIDHDTKAQLYMKLGAQGFPVPRTLMTNDPQKALAFVRDMGEVVAKPAVGIGATRKLNEWDLRRLDELQASPVLLQEYVSGPTLRVHIVADQVVLALRVISEEGYVDSRSAPKSFEWMQLPEAEAQRIVRANRALGLHFAAWDVLEGKDGHYVYLDCNPGPFILWIGPEHTRVVLRALAGYMLTFARTRSLEEAAAAVHPWHPI